MKNTVLSSRHNWLFPLLLLTACAGNTIYHDRVDFARGSWSAADTVHFSVLVADTSHFYDIYLNLRNKGNYPFSNLYVAIKTVAPTGASLSDTVEFILANARGEWLGRGFGDLWQSSSLYKSGIKFPHTGVYNFSVRQIMRPDALSGVSDFGMKIVKRNR